MKRCQWGALIAWFALPFASIVQARQPGSPTEVNLARTARIEVSSTRDPYVKDQAIDGKPETSWGSQLGLISGQWLQLDWDTTQTLCGLLLHQTGLFLREVNVLVPEGNGWRSVAHPGISHEPLGLKIVAAFPSLATRSVRLEFVGGAGLTEVEAYGNAQFIHREFFDARRAWLAISGDARGQLIGTISRDNGQTGVAGAPVLITGSTPEGSWKRELTSGEMGYFESPLPLTSSGLIEVRVSLEDQVVSRTLQTGDLSLSLTPRPPVGSPMRLPLEGAWDFMVDPPDDFLRRLDSLPWSRLAVPAHWEMEGHVSKRGLGLYRRPVAIPAEWSGRRIMLRSDGIYSACEAWLNGRRIGSHEGGATSFEWDLTTAARPGADNELVIKVVERARAADFDRMSYFAYFELAGIWRPIELFAVEPVHLTRLAVATDFDEHYRDAELRIDFTMVNAGAANANPAQVRFEILDPQGRPVADEWMTGPPAQAIPLGAWEQTSLTASARIATPRPWNAEQPRLYTLRAIVSAPGQADAVIEQPFGFREIAIQDRTFLVNGRPIKIFGVSRLDAHPLKGRALDDAVNRQDIELMKSANFNGLRVCVIPTHPGAIDLTDQQGLYVENDGPFCFVWDPARASDLRNAPFAVGAMSEFIERDRNHPSVVIWSICNESSFGPVFQLVHRHAKASDATRPFGTGQSATLDIATYHCPAAMFRVNDARALSVPVINDEGFPIFHGWGHLAQALELDPGIRDWWPTGMDEVREAIRGLDNFLGVMQFSWVDDTFLVPNKGAQVQRSRTPPIHFVDRVYQMPRRGMVGDFVWGTVDGWRRPRPEYFLSKKLYSPVLIPARMALPRAEGGFSLPVRNYNVFTNLDQYAFRWQWAGQHGEVRPDVDPLTTGTLTIPALLAASASGATEAPLRIDIADETGRVVDQYEIATAEPVRPAFPMDNPPAEVDIWPDDRYLQWARPLRLLGRETELSYDRVTGELMWALAGRQQVLTRGPHLHILRQAASVEPFPINWKLGETGTRTEANQSVITWNGSYDGFSGGFEMRMDREGFAEFRYRFTCEGQPLNMREIGLAFELPLAMDTLSWDRNAEFSGYPADHIGRPHGTARAHGDQPCSQPQSVPPGDRPFSQDDHPLGTNDFRSVKRNVYEARARAGSS